MGAIESFWQSRNRCNGAHGHNPPAFWFLHIILCCIPTILFIETDPPRAGGSVLFFTVFLSSIVPVLPLFWGRCQQSANNLRRQQGIQRFGGSLLYGGGDVRVGLQGDAD